MHGRRKLRGSAGARDLLVGMTGALLKAARRFFGRGVTQAVLVALAVRGTREISELLSERALAQLLPGWREREPIAGVLEQVLTGEPLQVGRKRRCGQRQKARELTHRGRIREALGAHPVHRLEDLVTDPERVKLAH